MPAAHEAQINLELGFIGAEIVWAQCYSPANSSFHIFFFLPRRCEICDAGHDHANRVVIRNRNWQWIQLDVAIDSHLQQQVLAAISFHLLT
jgi:hypothetical protein